MKVRVLALVFALFATSIHAADPLPSWNDTGPKQAIIRFVEQVTKEGSADFVPMAERIATFDNDGTLWPEQPMYFQAFFALDRVKALGPLHPEWREKEPFVALFKGNVRAFLASGEKGIMELLAATHAGMTTDEFEEIVTEWITTAKHPQTGKRFTEMVYQPMLELLTYLRENGFKTYIVSGGGIEFMRPWAERVYGIPPEQIVGSSGGMKYEVRDGKPVIVKLPELVLINDKEGKPVGIQRHIGRRPIAAFGNSDGDLQMLEWTAAGSGSRLCMYIHHTDADREYAYDRESHFGRLDKGLDVAKNRGWPVVSIKDIGKGSIHEPAEPSGPPGSTINDTAATRCTPEKSRALGHCDCCCDCGSDYVRCVPFTGKPTGGKYSREGGERADCVDR